MTSLTESRFGARSQIGNQSNLAKEFEFDFEAVFAPEDYLYFYEGILSEKRNNCEADFIEQNLALHCEHRIIDIACGHGRLTNLLAARGYKITGVDRSKGFLDIAKQDAASKGLMVDYIQGDMRELPFKEIFDRALLTFTSFGFFSDEDNLLVLRSVFRSLVPGGLFLFDALNRDTFLKYFVSKIVTERGSDIMIDRNSFDLRVGRVFNHRTTIRDGYRRDMRFSIRLYNLSEFDNLLKEAGFILEKVTGGYNGEMLDHDSRRLVMIARKPA